MLRSVVAEYKERYRPRRDKKIKWTAIALQMRKAGVKNRNNKSCRLRQELLTPLPAHAVLFHATSRDWTSFRSTEALDSFEDALLLTVVTRSLRTSTAQVWTS